MALREVKLTLPLPDSTQPKAQMRGLFRANSILKDYLIRECGGYTVLTAHGVWGDPCSTTVFSEKVAIYVVATDSKKFKDLLRLFRRLGRIGKQEAIYYVDRHGISHIDVV